MKISERNCPLLRYLKYTDTTLKNCPDFLTKQDFLRKSNSDDHSRISRKDLNDGWPMYSKAYSSSMDVLSQEFFNSMMSSWECLIKDNVLQDMIGNVISGTIFIPFKQVAISYLIKIDGLRKITRCISVFNDYTTLVYHTSSKSNYSTSDRAFLGNMTSDEFKMFNEYFPILFHLFRKYANVETKFVKRRSKLQKPNQEKEVNDTDFDMTHYDCTWFTTIVRSEGFKVRGHFRLQPYKDEDGEWTKKMIYINEFKKNGYSRKAQKLVEFGAEHDEIKDMVEESL